MSPARLSARRPVTVSQWASKNPQVTAACITAIGRTMISSDRPNSDRGSQRFSCCGQSSRSVRLTVDRLSPGLRMA